MLGGGESAMMGLARLETLQDSARETGLGEPVDGKRCGFFAPYTEAGWPADGGSTTNRGGRAVCLTPKEGLPMALGPEVRLSEMTAGSFAVRQGAPASEQTGGWPEPPAKQLT